MATDTKEVKAIARYIRMSPFKVRRVLDQIRGALVSRSINNSRIYALPSLRTSAESTAVGGRQRRA